MRLTTNDGPRVLIDVLRELDHAELSPATLAVHEPSLDDVFLALTGHRAESEETPAEPAMSGGRRRRRGRRERDRRRRRRPRTPALVRAVRDARAVTWRYLIHYIRVPQLLVFSTIQPVIFVLMFRYVFGGRSIRWTDPMYVEFLMPGDLRADVVFGAIATAIGLATDVKSGSSSGSDLADGPQRRPRRQDDGRPDPERLRRAADGGRRLRRSGSASTPASGDCSPGCCCCSSSATPSAGSSLDHRPLRRRSETQAAAFPLIAPLVFASSLFVPVEQMSWLQPWAEHQPVSVTASAVRDLMLGGTDTAYHVRSRSRGASGSC